MQDCFKGSRAKVLGEIDNGQKVESEKPDEFTLAMFKFTAQVFDFVPQFTFMFDGDCLYFPFEVSPSFSVCNSVTSAFNSILHIPAMS
jgi:hypothetical protein